MKKFTKLLGIVLIIALVMSMGAMALADGNGVASENLTISIQSQFSTRTYSAYQIFKGDIDNNEDADQYGNGNTRILSNIAWADEVDGDAMLAALLQNPYFRDAAKTAFDLPNNAETTVRGAVKTAGDVAKTLSYVSGADRLNAIAKIFAANKGAAAASTSTATSSGEVYLYTISGLDAGYYIVIDETDVVGTDTSASLYMLNVVGNTQITEKVVKPTVEKEVQDETADKDINSSDANGWGDTADHAINESFRMRVTATVPVNDYILQYINERGSQQGERHYQIKFIDTMSKGLTLERVESVTVKGYNVTTEPDETSTYGEYPLPNVTENQDYKEEGYTVTNNMATDSHGNYVGDGEKTLEISIWDLYEDFADPYLDLTKGVEVVVEYSVHLNEEAFVTPVGGTTTTNLNKVKLQYLNNPYAYTFGETPEETVYIFTYEIDNMKLNGGSRKAVAETDEIYETLDALENTVTLYKASGKAYLKEDGTWYEYGALANAGFRLYADADCTKEIPLVYEESESKPAYRPIYTATEYLGQSEERNKYQYEDPRTTETGVEMKSDENGLFNIIGLDAGNYWLKETTTPPGYNTVDNIAVSISASHQVSDGNPTVVLTETNTNNAIVDQSGTVLPSTGGIGTTIFYVVGSIMVVAAGVLLITKKRMGRE